MVEIASQPEQSFKTASDALHNIDLRLRGLRTNNPESAEVIRMEAARTDVVSRMTAQEVTAYDERHTVKKTAIQEAQAAQEIARAMDENKDRPSI